MPIFTVRYLLLRMNPGEVVLEGLAAVGGEALPDVRRKFEAGRLELRDEVGVHVNHRARVLGQVPERKRRLPGAVRPRDYMAYWSRLFVHFSFIISKKLAGWEYFSRRV